MPAHNAALTSLHRLFDAINAGDAVALTDTITDVVTDDFVDHASPVQLPPGPAGYAEILRFVATVLQVRYDIADVFSTEDRIVVRAIGHGRGVAAVHGDAGAGKPYAMNTVHIYRTTGDKLAEHWGVRDEAGVLIQLGVLPAPHVVLDPSSHAASVPAPKSAPGRAEVTA